MTNLLLPLVLGWIGFASSAQHPIPETPRVAHQVGQLSETDWLGLRATYQANRHRIAAAEDGFRGHNPGQRWGLFFDGEGFLAQPDAGAWAWGLKLEGFGCSECKKAQDQPTHIAAQGARVVYSWSGGLEEWFVNDSRGLEHGFTIHEPPCCRDERNPCGCSCDELVFDVSVRGGLRPCIAEDGRDVDFVDESGVSVLRYVGLKVFDALGSDLQGAFTPVQGGLRLTVSARTAHYPITVDPIAQQAYLKASNPDNGDTFGWTAAIDGETVVVGAPGEESSGTGINGDQSDNSLFLAGAAYVFVRQGNAWVQQAYLKASNTGQSDTFGHSVAIAGNTIVVGAPGEDSDATGVNGNQTDNSASSSGAVYVFVRNGTQWTQQAYIKASNTGSNDRFGDCVSISGDTLVVGAMRESSNATGVDGDQADDSAFWAGAAYVFVRNGALWSQQAYLKASNTEDRDEFGGSVSISDDTLIVGAQNEDSVAIGVDGDQADNSRLNAGAAYVFVRSDSNWTQQAYLKASNTGILDRFGSAVSIDGDLAVVGARFEASSATGIDGDQSDNSVNGAGAAYVFERSQGAWEQTTYMKASNPGTGDTPLFGSKLVCGNDVIVVSATLEDSGATGIDGDQTDASASDSGAAYVFERDGQSWIQTAYVKASNTDTEDHFGHVAIAGNTIVIGAWGEDSGSAGLDGDQSDNSSSAAGAVYAFTIEPPPECFLVLGNDRYAAPFTGGNYTWTVSVGQVLASFPVLLDQLPTFPLPEVEPLLGSVGSGPHELGASIPVATFTAQVVMYNPTDFPLFPEQWSNALEVTLWSNGKLHARPYADANGMQLWSETFVGLDGKLYARFPFSIDALTE